MLERIQVAPAHALAFDATGTVVASDVEVAVESALGSASAATGVVVVVSRDFDGYFAELERGLANVAAKHKTLTRVAIVTDADRVDEARLSPWGGPTAPIRVFARDELRVAYDWADAARAEK